MKTPRTATKKLGKLTKTLRGFHLVKFKDEYKADCSLQVSSIDCPGGAVWLGVDEPKIVVIGKDGWKEFLLPFGAQNPSRMHLTRNQVVGLVKRLNTWLKTGQL